MGVFSLEFGIYPQTRELFPLRRGEFIGITRGNTTECRARPAQRPQPLSLRCEIDRSHRNPPLAARSSAPPARNGQTIGECRVRYLACCSGYPQWLGEMPRSFVSPASRSKAK